MLCPKCKCETMIARTYYETRNDDTPDVPTEVYLCQDFCCRNKNCEEYDPKFNDVLSTVKHLVAMKKGEDNG